MKRAGKQPKASEDADEMKHNWDQQTSWRINIRCGMAFDLSCASGFVPS